MLFTTALLKMGKNGKNYTYAQRQLKNGNIGTV